MYIYDKLFYHYFAMFRNFQKIKRMYSNNYFILNFIISICLIFLQYSWKKYFIINLVYILLLLSWKKIELLQREIFTICSENV